MRNIIHYYDGTISNDQLIDHVGSNNGITGTAYVGTSDYGPTVKFISHLYEISHPSISTKLQLVFDQLLLTKLVLVHK